ncbi:MAG: 50S ribosomal protein L18e [Candidatus Micrarchaeota archaeon]|nr:50S ribosomal protein L18e [Candidatus Micrarchaeota archaeon]
MNRIVEKDSINAWVEAISTVKADAKNAGLWKRVGKMVLLPKRARVSVNLSKLQRVAKDGDFIVVPGKVLSFGSVSRKFKIAAVGYSEVAAHKLKAVGCEMVTIEKMTKEANPRIVV